MSKKEKSELPVINTNISIDVIVTDDMYEQIKFLTSNINNKEWSGILLYSTEGEINDYENFKITLQHIHLMDIGNGVATNYELDESIVDLKMSDPKFLKYRMGHIHSHHTMDAYFSPTDMEEIIENSEYHNYYLSVIVNNAGKIVGKIAFHGSIDAIKAFNTTGENYITKLKDQYVFIYQCKIVNNKRFNVSNLFQSRYEEVIKNIAERNKPEKSEEKDEKAVKMWPQNNTNQTYNEPESIYDTEEEKDYDIDDFIIYLFGNLDIESSSAFDSLIQDVLDASEIFGYLEMLSEKMVTNILDTIVKKLDDRITEYFGFGVDYDNIKKDVMKYLAKECKEYPDSVKLINKINEQLINDFNEQR